MLRGQLLIFVLAYEKAIIDYAVDMHLFAEVYGLKAFARAALTRETIDFHIVFSVIECYNLLTKS